MPSKGLFQGKETKKEEAAEMKLPAAAYKKGEMKEAKMKKMANGGMMKYADGGYVCGHRSEQDYGKGK